MPSPRSTFLEAAAAVAGVVDLIPPTAWDGPGLGAWNLRALVGHTSRSLVTVVEYLARPAAADEIATPEAYYAAVARIAGADPVAVLERGRAAGVALGDDPAAGFRDRLDAAVAALEHADDDDLMSTIAGGMRLAAYLPTRTFELAVHGMDIATATGIPVAFPSSVLVESTELAARVAVQRGDGPTVLAGLTGRSGLPAGFSVV